MSYAGPSASPGRFRALADLGDPDRTASIAVFMAGVVLGLAVGAGAALLLAPEAGEDTRRSLVRRGRRITRRGRDAWEDLGDEFRRLTHLRR